MQTKLSTPEVLKAAVMMLLFFQLFSCKKTVSPEEQVLSLQEQINVNSEAGNAAESQYNLEVVLRGEGNRNGHIHAIHTDEKGNGQDELWRDVTAIPSGASFDIHFRVIDAVTLEVVLESDCYQYTVR